MPKYNQVRGVYPSKAEGKFNCKIAVSGIRKNIGTFTDVQAAAKEFDNVYEFVWGKRPNNTLSDPAYSPCEKDYQLLNARVQMGLLQGGRGRLTGNYSEYSDGVDLTPAANKWVAMMSRVTEQSKIRHPTYRHVEVCAEWHDFTEFNKWYTAQPDHRKVSGWQLDKDVLGGSVYSPDNSLLVPRDINMVTVKCDASRGEFPIGVSYVADRDLYCAHISYPGTQKNLGNYFTPEIAFGVYKRAKEAYAKELATKWQSQIDPRAYEALMNYTVEITD